MQMFYAKRGKIWVALTYCFDVMSIVCQQRSECKKLDAEDSEERWNEDHMNTII